MTGRPLLVNVVLFRLADETLQVLLASRAQGWELPGSELDELEGLEQAAERAIAALLDRRKTTSSNSLLMAPMTAHPSAWFTSPSSRRRRASSPASRPLDSLCRRRLPGSRPR